MKSWMLIILLTAGAGRALPAQSLHVTLPLTTDTAARARALTTLAQQTIERYTNTNREVYLNDLFLLQLAAGRNHAALATIDAYRVLRQGSTEVAFPELEGTPYRWYAEARIVASSGNTFATAFRQLFLERYTALPDKAAAHIAPSFATSKGLAALQRSLTDMLQQYTGQDSLTVPEAVRLCRQYALHEVYRRIEPLAAPLLQADDARRYVIEPRILITTPDGAQLAAFVVRRNNAGREPAALLFTIYADSANLHKARWAAACGYAGVVVYTRGKAFSPDAAVPYEREVTDVNAAIDWITRQPWNDGRVGMYGGSYEGFSQWAATKHLHPALKTIVPYVAAIPGQGVPMENNVFINANYAWPFYVTNKKYLDNITYADRRWHDLPHQWYASGAAYARIDSIDGTPNPWLQRWLQHPAFDRYWQAMIPYKKDFAHINIPILSITGYYDDGQISALQYLKDHYRYNPRAEHYLIIGPYDHVGAQRGGVPVLRGYTVDPVSLIRTRDITFQWLDYVMKGGRKPELLKDRINYQVMGTNAWHHASSLTTARSRFMELYLTDVKRGNNYTLATQRPRKPQALHQTVDLSDRTTSNNTYYPYPIIRDSLDRSNGLFFITEPLEKELIVTGTFEGQLRARINKRDMDVGVVLYEVMPDGRFFHLSYFLGRASYATDASQRKLLTPGKTETIPFNRTRMVSRKLSKGSRLMVVLNINKNPFAQVNYGTGKDVSQETIHDAGAPLEIDWYTDSVIRIPVSD